MWWMNHVMNPIMKMILRSPFRSLLGSSLLLITYRGRKSGKTYTLPVQYAQAGEKIYILPGSPERKTWWRNLRGGAPVSIEMGGQKLDATAGLLTPEHDCDEIEAALGAYFRRFPPSARLHQVEKAPDGTFRAEDIRRVAAAVVMVRVVPHIQ